MCEPISWKEVNGKIYFITSADLKSDRGKELLKSSKDNDPLGHGFIEAYWGIIGGKQFENKDFWDKKNYPKEIQDTLGENFDKNWEHIWIYANNDDLHYIVCYAPKEHQEKAWNILRPRANNRDWRFIVCHGPEEYRQIAWDKLSHQANNSDLVYIVCYGPTEYKKKAWSILHFKVDISNLSYIACHGVGEYQITAQNELDKNGYNGCIRYYLGEK